MAVRSLEGQVIAVRAKLAALRGDERADLPSGQERTAYNAELRRVAKLAQNLEAAFSSPDYAPVGIRDLSRPPKPKARPPKPRPVVAVVPVAYGPRKKPQVLRSLSKKKLEQAGRRTRRDAATRKTAEVMRLRATAEWQAFNQKVVRENLALQAIHQAERVALLARRALIAAR